MPSRRFWMLERQIDRIQAENEIRLIQTNMQTASMLSKEQIRQVEEHIGRLTLQIGEKLTVRRNVYVAPEPGAAAKFNRIIGMG